VRFAQHAPPPLTMHHSTTSHSFSLSLLHSFSNSRMHSIHSATHSFSHSLMKSLTHSLIHSFTHSHIHSATHPFIHHLPLRRRTSPLLNVTVRGDQTDACRPHYTFDIPVIAIAQPVSCVGGSSACATVSSRRDVCMVVQCVVHTLHTTCSDIIFHPTCVRVRFALQA
jgi:hypothetical protein